MKYSKRIVCFFDILGFKNLIIDSSKNPAIINKIHELLAWTKQIQCQHPYETKASGIFDPTGTVCYGKFNPKISAEMSFFSDSVILSYGLDKPRDDIMDLNEVFWRIANILFDFVCSGFFVRGGIAYGDIYHDGNICFGPALVEAATLESKTIYPRIAFSPNFFDKTSKDSPLHIFKELENTQPFKNNLYHIKDRFYCEYIDGTPYFDFLDPCLSANGIAAIRRIKQIIQDELHKPYNEHIMQKYLWFKEYYNATVYNTLGYDEKIE